ncbi:MAG TPA: hypothetical protein VES96_04805 [Nitrospiraceae bacterium]|nr:hypothetical protein [Nitrospiraceae bacterium]
MSHFIEQLNRTMPSVMPIAALLLGAVILLVPAVGSARDLMTPKEQGNTGDIDPAKLPSFNQQKQGVPQSIFVSIQMARGFQEEWDSFGRKGWYTQDPRLKPIDPGTTVFAPDASAVYIVFEVAPLEDPAQFSAQWFLLDKDDKPSAEPAGKDTLEVPGHERYGYLELKKPAGGNWTRGSYLVKLFITPLGQQPFHAANQVGTMQFKIADPANSPGAAAQK